jgi:hypothetical protein
MYMKCTTADSVPLYSYEQYLKYQEHYSFLCVGYYEAVFTPHLSDCCQSYMRLDM